MAAYTKTIAYSDTWTMLLESGAGTVALKNNDTDEIHYLDIPQTTVWMFMLATSRLHVDELCQALFDANTSSTPLT